MVWRVVVRFSYFAPGWTYSLSARGGEILLLTPSLWFGAWWGDSLTRPKLNISHHRSMHGGGILLLAPGWTSLILVLRMVGRFSYSPQAGYISLSFSAWWGDSLTCPRLELSHHCLAHGEEILLLAPGWTSLIIIWHMVERFSYSPLAGHL